MVIAKLPKSFLAALVFAALSLSSFANAQADEKHPRIDLNQASVVELTKLPGIGRKRAEDIVRRRANKAFAHIREITRVRGIGWRTYQSLKDRIKVEPTSRRKSGRGRAKAKHH